MRSGPCFLILLVVTPQLLVSGEARFACPPTISLEQVRQCMDESARQHPRLLATGADLAALRETAGANPLRQAMSDAVVRQADLLLDASPITRSLQGRRLLGRSR